MFPFLQKSREPVPQRRRPRHQLGIDHRLESRHVPSTVALAGGVLTVQGTNAADSIQLVQSGSSRGNQFVSVNDNGQLTAMFAVGELKRIEVYGMGGDDKISLAGVIKVPTILDGGDGDDSIVSGSVGAVVLGRAGNDLLMGGAGRDILIGGAGSDKVDGNGGDDIVTGDSTQADDNSGALTSILEIWNSELSYDERVNALRPNSEIAGPRRTPDLTLIDDGTHDVLSGNLGQDWFLVLQSDTITDRVKGEAVM